MNKQEDSTYRAALAAIWERSGYDRGFISNPFAGDDAARLGLKRTSAVLAVLGDPQRRVPLIHVAGSKGKGSTTVLLDAMLRATGKRTGRFTSPHLHSYRERFIVDDQPIGEDDFASLTNDVMAAVMEVEAEHPELGQVTAWELSTAMTLQWFAHSRCDVAVIEVGLGGTLDATNVIDPVVSVITRLDLEHTAILGDTLPEIAANKAGIIKPGRPAVTAGQPADALEVIVDRAREVGSGMLVQGRDWTVDGDERAFTVSGPWGSVSGLRTSLIGAHQVENAALAVTALKTAFASDPAITDEAIRAGLRSASHPGRFEILTAGESTIVIDGAHTPIAATALANALERHIGTAPVTFVIGMLSDKHPGPFLEPLVPRAGRWIVAEPETPRKMSATELVDALTPSGIPVEQAGSVGEAIDIAIQDDPDPGVVVVTGSLTTVAEARVHLGLGVPDPPPG